MFISHAYAAAEAVTTLPDAPSAGEALMWNVGLVMMIVVLFYLLLIRPQQRRFKEHSEMLSNLKKGDKVVTGGGLIGKIDKIEIGNDEVVIDLGNGTKVTALRSMIHGKDSPLMPQAAANDAKTEKAGKKK